VSPTAGTEPDSAPLEAAQAGRRATALSVVVPTRDRPAALERCLEALARQSVDELYEVVVVDDGSVNENAVARLVQVAPNARVIRHGQGRGPAAARNSGIHSSSGRFVFLTDDDCEPDEDWLERLRARLRAGADAVAGSTVNASPSDVLAEASQLVAAALMRSAPGDPAGLVFAPSSNLACRREVLVAVPFDERYPAAAGEDRDWCARLRGAGFRLEHEPRAVVRHNQQLDLGRFWRQHRGYGEAARWFRAAHPGDAVLEARFYLRLVATGFRRGPGVGLAMLLAQLATLVGYATASPGRH
jgi:GT2 family glycosyltransferase